MTTEPLLEEGYRSLAVHDVVDGDRHEVVVQFPHEVIDGYRTDWGRGCFDDSLNTMLPPLVWNHDKSDLIGRAYKWESTGDRTLLFSRFSDFDAVPRARQAFAQIRDGDVPGFSFHYTQGRSVAHPNIRGARRFVSALMTEHSPVTVPSIPGAVAVGVRSQEATLTVPSIQEILALRDVVDEEGVRALIAEHYPNLRDHIRITTPVPPTDERLAELTGQIAESGVRDLVIHVAADGTVTSAKPDDLASMGADDEPDDDEDPATLAAAVDAALDAATALLEGVDLTVLPEPVQQAAALVNAASVAIDELLDVMGVSDPDEDGGQRAQLSSAEMDDLPDSSFAYVEPDGTKDGSGKTVPRSKRHFAIHDAAHVRNALARIGQGAEFAKEAAPKVEAAAKKFGIDHADSGKRSEPEPPAPPERDEALEADLARAQERLARR